MNRSILGCAGVALTGVLLAGCGSSDPALNAGSSPDGGGSTVQLAAPVLLTDVSEQCTDPHTVCMTVKMPHTMPGAPTHLAVGYYKAVPVMTPAEARGVLEAPALVVDQVFRLKVGDGNLIGAYYPVVLVYMPGGGDIIAVDNLDYTAEAPQTSDFTGDALNVQQTLNLVFGI